MPRTFSPSTIHASNCNGPASKSIPPTMADFGESPASFLVYICLPILTCMTASFGIGVGSVVITQNVPPCRFPNPSVQRYSASTQRRAARNLDASRPLDSPSRSRRQCAAARTARTLDVLEPRFILLLQLRDDFRLRGEIFGLIGIFADIEKHQFGLIVHLLFPARRPAARDDTATERAANARYISGTSPRCHWKNNVRSGQPPSPLPHARHAPAINRAILRHRRRTRRRAWRYQYARQTGSTSRSIGS